MKIGFIGIGAMGKPMATRLLKMSHEIFACNKHETPVTELVSQGAVGCKTPEDVAAHAQVIFLSLPNVASVEEVVAGERGLLCGARAGQVIVDLSSVDPDCSRRLASLAGAKEVDYMDAPVSGGVAGAAAGTLTIMVGASAKALEKVRALLEVLGKKIVHVGDVGSGDAIKIVNNMILGANMAVLAEALVLGKKLGLSGEIMHEIISQGSGQSYVLDAKLEKFILKDNFQPGFALDLQFKDLGLALDAAKGAHMPLPMATFVTQFYEMARVKGFGKMDMSALIKVWEDLCATALTK